MKKTFIFLIIITILFSINTFCQDLSFTFFFNSYLNFYPLNISESDTSFTEKNYIQTGLTSMIKLNEYIYFINNTFYDDFNINTKIITENGIKIIQKKIISSFLLGIKTTYPLITSYYMKISLMLDFYPKFFVYLNGQLPFYPQKLFTPAPFDATSSTSDLKFNTRIGLYVYQNEFSLKFNYFEKRKFIDSDYNYDSFKQWQASLYLQNIPTYLLMGYYIDIGLKNNSITFSTNTKKSYYVLYLTGGLIFKIIDNIYIWGGINFDYIRLSTTVITPPKIPVGFDFKISYEI